MATAHYAWSDLYNGGEHETIDTVHGERTVVKERYVTHRGEKVTKSSLKVSDEEWDRLCENGSIRDYPVPEEASDYVSPAQAVLTRLLTDRGEIDQNVLIELAMKHPPALNPPADEAAEVPAGA